MQKKEDRVCIPMVFPSWPRWNFYLICQEEQKEFPQKEILGLFKKINSLQTGKPLLKQLFHSSVDVFFPVDTLIPYFKNYFHSEAFYVPEFLSQEIIPPLKAGSIGLNHSLNDINKNVPLLIHELSHVLMGKKMLGLFYDSFQKPRSLQQEAVGVFLGELGASFQGVMAEIELKDPELVKSKRLKLLNQMYKDPENTSFFMHRMYQHAMEQVVDRTTILLRTSDVPVQQSSNIPVINDMFEGIFSSEEIEHLRPSLNKKIKQVCHIVDVLERYHRWEKEDKKTCDTLSPLLKFKSEGQRL